MNLQDVTPETTHPDWDPGVQVNVYEAPREIESPVGKSRYVVAISGYGMVGAGLGTPEGTPLDWDAEPEVMFPADNAQIALDEFLNTFAPELAS